MCAFEYKEFATLKVEEEENERPEEEEHFTFDALVRREFLTFFKTKPLGRCTIMESKYMFSENFCYSLFHVLYAKK